MRLDLFLGDVCPHAEASQAGGVGEVAKEAGARQGVLPQARRTRQDHTRPADIVDFCWNNYKVPKHYSGVK